jgi:hypothetical protein
MTYAPMDFVAVLNGAAPQLCSNAYDAMAAIGTEGAADVLVDTGGHREPLLHRDSDGTWSEVA